MGRLRFPRNTPFHDRLVATEAGCLEWQGYRETFGYGQIRINGKLYKAHRYAFELAYGPIPEGLVICHRCDNPPCCNPEHLFLGTHADNIADRCAKGRTRTGHLYGEESVSAILTAADVISIRTQYAAGGVTQTGLASEYGVTQSAIWLIVHNKKWRNL